MRITTPRRRSVFHHVEISRKPEQIVSGGLLFWGSMMCSTIDYRRRDSTGAKVFCVNRITGKLTLEVLKKHTGFRLEFRQAGPVSRRPACISDGRSSVVVGLFTFFKRAPRQPPGQKAGTMEGGSPLKASLVGQTSQSGDLSMFQMGVPYA